MKLFKNSIIYTAVTLLQRSMGLILLPLYTFYISPDEYGTLNVIISITQFISILFLLAIPNSNTRFHYLYNNQKERQQKVWGTNLTMVYISMCAFLIVFFLFKDLFISYFASDIPFVPYILIALGTAILNPLYLFFQSYLQTSQQGVAYGINLTIYFLVNTILIVILLIFFDLGIMSILIGNFVTSALFALYTVLFFFPKIKLGLDREQVKQTLGYSLPLVPHSVSFWGISMLDRVLLNKISSSHDTGVYSVGAQIGGTINIVTSSINQAYNPWLYKELSSTSNFEQTKIEINKTALLISKLYCFVAFVIALLSQELISLLSSGSAYNDAWRVVPLISFSCVFLGYYHFFVNIILYEKKTFYIPVVTIIALGLSIALNILLIPRFGYLAAGISNFISYFILSFLSLQISRKIKPEVTYPYYQMYGYLFLLFAFAGLLYINIDIDYWSKIVVKVAIILLIGTCIFIKDIKNLKGLIGLFYKK